MPDAVDTNTSNLKAARRQFAVLGWAVFAILAVTVAGQFAAEALTWVLWPQGDGPGWLLWACSFVPLYLLAVPAGLLILRRVPAAPPPVQSLRPGQCAAAGFISIFAMYAGNLLGTLVLTLLQALLGRAAVNPILTFALDDAVGLRVLVMAVLAPLIEEYLFRRQLIDRMRPYGEKLAVAVSALVFGLFHGNLSQFFYAFALGLVFGYLYLRTGRLRYSAALHIFINTLGGVVAPALLGGIDAEALQTLDPNDWEAVAALIPQLVPLLLYALAMVAASLAGLVLFCIQAQKLHFSPAPQQLPRGARAKTVFLNPGMLLFIAGTLILIAMTFVG